VHLVLNLSWVGMNLTGSLVSAVLLIAGTTVGAGILAIPSVTQESGFLASSVACIGCWLYMVRRHFFLKLLHSFESRHKRLVSVSI